MRTTLLIACVMLVASQANADIEVTDGGFQVTTYHPDGTSGTVRRDSFTVKGTGTDAQEALAIADRKSAERAREFDKVMDRLIGDCLRPTCPCPRRVMPCSAPCVTVAPPCPPTPFPFPPPLR